MIRLKNISHDYDRQIFKSANLFIKRNEILGIVGHSGVGKSTLLKIIAGKLQPTKGSLFWESELMPNMKNLLIPGFKNISIVNQDFKLDQYHTVTENIRESILAMPFNKREKRIDQLIKIFGLKSIANTKADLISGGEKQRLAIARAIAFYPDLLLLDEPFSHLDATIRIKLIELLIQLRNEENMTLVLVSHDPLDILGMCDNICFLRNKKISRKHSPEGLYYNLRNLQLAKLFGPVNNVIWNGINYRFRPDEYVVSNSDQGIPVRFINHIFFNGFYQNFFLVESLWIVLYSQVPLKKVNRIEVRNKLK